LKVYQCFWWKEIQVHNPIFKQGEMMRFPLDMIRIKKAIRRLVDGRKILLSFYLGKTLAELGKQGISLKYDKIHKVLGEGNFMMVVSEGHFGKSYNAFYDLFRVENGKIAEHWDVIEPIPAR
jgi:predicted SnoaL-like aldol condensation-catalyzing enzyme